MQGKKHISYERNIHQKLHDAVLILVIGDALDVPYEFQERSSFTCTGMSGYRTHDQPPGMWSDDTSMTLALLKSLGYDAGILYGIDPDEDEWMNILRNKELIEECCENYKIPELIWLDE